VLAELDDGLKHLAALVQSQLNRDVADSRVWGGRLG
jgi:hypothetical protein